jgi:hypothetical protein
MQANPYDPTYDVSTQDISSSSLPEDLSIPDTSNIDQGEESGGDENGDDEVFFGTRLNTTVNITHADKQLTDQFISELENASLEKSSLSEVDIVQLQCPPQQHANIESNFQLKYSLRYYIDTLGSSDETYKNVVNTSHEMHQIIGNSMEFLSHDAVKNCAKSLAHILTAIHHVCPQGCMAYTSPFSELDECPTCSTSPWDPLKLLQVKKAPAQSFTTITLGSQLQNLYSTPQGAQ